MCGIAGFFQQGGFRSEEAENIAVNMANKLIHRGPDDSGVWVDGESGIALSHRRLTILELSSAGHQPMISASGRYVLVFNGEIYNHLTIRSKIEVSEKIDWRGHSDTETLLASFDYCGIEETLKNTVGMFAFAVWDRKERSLSLARDRMGEKPLYYGWQDDVFIFASEIKAIKVHPSFSSDTNRSVLPFYLHHGYIPAPYSIYKNIYKLMPGTCIKITEKSLPNEFLEPKPYWILKNVIDTNPVSLNKKSDKEVIAGLENCLHEAISIQKVADVPLGAFLSGGIDSSTIVALMQSQSSSKINTFTIGFYEQEYNEAENAEVIAKHLGTNHTTMYVSTNDVLDTIPDVHSLYDEPFTDGSGSLLVSRLAREKVKVALSGDGGDELFGGYNAYHMCHSLWNKTQVIPSFISELMTKSVPAIPTGLLNTLVTPLLNMIGHSTSIPAGMRIKQLTKGLECHSLVDFYQLMKSHGCIEQSLIKNLDKAIAEDVSNNGINYFNDDYSSMLYLDTLQYLPDHILTKVDQTAMTVSLETRAPFLDHRVVEYAWGLPMDQKIRNGKGKWPLIGLLGRYIPEECIDQPKRGFTLPMGDWLRGPLRDWTDELLSKERLMAEGYFEPDKVRTLFEQHINKKYNWQELLWRIIAFQSWNSKV